ncbi:MAG: Fur family transcriptional regulator [Desulfobacterales bacterium]
MCHQCNYSDLLKACGLRATRNRLGVLEIIGSRDFPLSAADIYHALKDKRPINRVTVYRILDLLVARGLVQRLSGGGRSFVYGPAPSDFHPAHPHFYCKSCGHMECLKPQSLHVDTKPMQQSVAGRIENVEVRVDGICETCLQTIENSTY